MLTDDPAAGPTSRQWAIVAISYPPSRTAHQCERMVAEHTACVDVEALPSATPGRAYLLLTPAPDTAAPGVSEQAAQIVANPQRYGLLAAAATTPLT